MARKVVAMEDRLLAVFTAGLGSVNVSGLCRDLGISRESFYKYRRRFEAEGLAGLVERSRRPSASPYQTSPEMEDLIVKTRKQLAEVGNDCGAQSVVYRLVRDGWEGVPSVATTHRVLVRRGQVISQPHKRPKSAGKRFRWPNPNGAWQMDGTATMLADGTDVWIIDSLDDHSRLVPSALACAGLTTEAAWEALCLGAEKFGLPAHLMSDNGSCFTGRFLGGQVLFETNLRAAGIKHILSSPGHPQTCGKLERFHQTLKRWLAARPLPTTIAELQALLDKFLDYYNHHRPHRALGGATPLEAWQAQPPAIPTEPIPATGTARLRVIDDNGRLAIGNYIIGIGAPHAARTVLTLIKGLDVTIIGRDNGHIIRRFTIDTTRRYQPSGRPPGRRPKQTGPCH